MTNPTIFTMLAPLAIAQAPPGINTRPAPRTPTAPTPADSFEESPIPTRQEERVGPTRLSLVDAYIRRGNSDPITKRMQELGLTSFFSDGSFSRPEDTGRYYWQADNTIYYTGGVIDSKYSPPSTLVNGTWETTKDKPLPSTFAIASLDLVPNDDGSFRCGRNNCTGKYFIQPNGTIFYEGGNIDGVAKPAQTYNPSTGWDTNLKEPDPVTRYGIRPHGNDWVHTQSKTILTNTQLDQLRTSGYFTVAGDPRKYVILPDGRVFTPGGGPDFKNPQPGGYITNGVWQEDPRTIGGSANRAAYHDLVPANDGSGEFIEPGKPTGYRFIAQEDGSMVQYHPQWVTGNRDVWGPITLRDGAWRFVHPIKPDDFLKVYGCTRHADGAYTSPIFNGSFHTRDGQLYWMSPDKSRCFLLDSQGKFVEQKPRS